MQPRDEGAPGTHRARPRPRLSCFPSSDRVFATIVDKVAGGLALRSPDELVEALRPLYPLLSVHPRQLAGEAVSIWYVYRERMFPAHPDDIRDG